MIVRLLFILATIFTPYAYAYLYNDSLLLIYAKIIPRVMALDHTKRDRSSAPPTLCILYEKNDERVAKKLAKMIASNLPKRPGDSLTVRTKPYGALPSCQKASALVLLNTNVERVKRTVDFAKSHRLLSFAYDKSMLRYGVIVSLHTGKKVYPIVNIDGIKQSGLRLDPLIYQVAKIYKGGGS